MNKICNRCVLPDSYPGIHFDEKGICNYCHGYETQWASHDYGKTEKKLKKILKAAKAKNRPYDCIVPLSGGLDSSYTLCLIKQFGLKPLAVNYNNGFQAEVARRNIKKITTALNVDLKVIAPDPSMLKKLYKIFLLSGAEPCTPCELGGTGAIFREAQRNNVPLVVFGTSERTEGITPKEIHYFDARYFKDVVKQKIPKADINEIFLFPNLVRMFYLQIIKRTRVIQMPYYMPWNEEKIANHLADRFGWEKGEDIHADCYFFPIKDHLRYKKWNFGARTQCYSAKIRDGQLKREEALTIIKRCEGQLNDKKIQPYLEQIGISKNELESIESKDYRHFKSYLPLLSKLNWILQLLSICNLLPENITKKFK